MHVTKSKMLRATLPFLMIAAAFLLLCGTFAGLAHADEGYQLRLQVPDSPKSIGAGDTFTVEQAIGKADESSFPMYAISATIGYDQSMLELVSCTAADDLGDVYSKNGSIVYNAYSRVLDGTEMESGTVLSTMVFKALKEGATVLEVKRVNVSNYTGMRSMPCQATGLSVNIGDSSDSDAILPTPSEEGTTAGNATGEDWEHDTVATVDATSGKSDAKQGESASPSPAEEGSDTETAASTGNATDEKAADVPSAADDPEASDDSTTSNKANAGDTGYASPTPITLGCLGLIAIAAIVLFLLRKRKSN